METTLRLGMAHASERAADDRDSLDPRNFRTPRSALIPAMSFGAARIHLMAGLLLSAGAAFSQPQPCAADAFLDVSKLPGPGPGYPRPRVAATCEGDELVVRSNGIPHYEFVQITPNPLLEQDYEFRVPSVPSLADAPTPIPLLGSIGFAVNGVVIFGPNEGPVPEAEQFGDPVFNAILDACMGHTALAYHYHAMVQACLSEDTHDGDPSPILGFGFDGFPIRGPWGCADADCSDVIRYRSSWERVREPHQDSWDAYEFVAREGKEYLDPCNGHTGPSGDYHYHVTESWPYILGCYAGTPVGPGGRGARRPAVSDAGRDRSGPSGPPRARRGPRAAPARPGRDAVAAAARTFGVDGETVARALRVERGSVKPVNLAASARTLGVTPDQLIEALGIRQPVRRPRRNQAPPGEPECFFRCGQSDDDAVGCTLTPEHEVRCYRACSDNRCG